MDTTNQARVLLASLETELRLSGLEIPISSRANLLYLIDNALMLANLEARNELLVVMIKKENQTSTYRTP